MFPPSVPVSFIAPTSSADTDTELTSLVRVGVEFATSVRVDAVTVALLSM